MQSLDVFDLPLNADVTIEWPPSRREPRQEWRFGASAPAGPKIKRIALLLRGSEEREEAETTNHAADEG